MALEAELAKTAADKKKLETDVAGLQDENRTLKTIPAPRTAKAEKVKRHFLEGATFFDQD